MSLRGRPRKPNARHKLIGSYKPSRHGEDPELPEGEAECPAWVHELAREYWDDAVDRLRGMGVMSPHYAMNLAMMLDSLGFFIECTIKSREHSPVSETAAGNEITNPWWSARSKALEQVHKLSREFGMTPASVSSLMSTMVSTKENPKESIADCFNPKLVG